MPEQGGFSTPCSKKFSQKKQLNCFEYWPINFGNTARETRPRIATFIVQMLPKFTDVRAVQCKKLCSGQISSISINLLYLVRVYYTSFK